MASSYLNYHFTGNFLTSIENGIEGSYNATLELTDYLTNLSIDNAQEKCLGQTRGAAEAALRIVRRTKIRILRRLGGGQ